MGKDTPAAPTPKPLSKADMAFYTFANAVKRGIRKLSRDDNYPITDVIVTRETVDIVEGGRVAGTQKILRVVVVAKQQRGYVDFNDSCRVIIRQQRLSAALRNHMKTFEVFALPPSKPESLV